MKLVGGLIGKGGEAIKSLQQEGCASISVGKPKAGDELQRLSIKACSEREADECEELSRNCLELSRNCLGMLRARGGRVRAVGVEAGGRLARGGGDTARLLSGGGGVRLFHGPFGEAPPVGERQGVRGGGGDPHAAAAAAPEEGSGGGELRREVGEEWTFPRSFSDLSRRWRSCTCSPARREPRAWLL